MKKQLSFLLIGLVTICSCTRNLEGINQNPNNPTRVEPDFLLTTSIFETLNLYGGPMNRVVFYNYTHHFAGFQGEFQRYNVGIGENNTFWKNTYIRCLQPVNQIEVNYKDNPLYKNRVIIARIWKDFIFSNTLSIWGSIPTSGALSGTPSVPYQKEEDIYYALLDDLKGLADSINLNGDKYTTIADKVYGGDLLKWKKFATTLRLRLAMRISNDVPNGNPTVAKKVAEEIFQNPQFIMSNQAETAAATWGTTSDTWSHLYDRVVYNYTANKATIPVLNESLVYHMAPYSDPRLGVYAQPAKQGPMIGKYFGQNISYGGGGTYAGSLTNPHTGLKQDDYSYIGERFLKPDAEYIFLSYAEACFLKAEAALKGYTTSATASQYYYEGIDASFNRYGLTAAQATAYKNTPGVKWGTASDTVGRSAQFKDWLQIASSYIAAGDYFKQVIMQHWLAIPNQGVDAWALIRRTRVLEFQPQFSTYDGNYAYVPNRLPYPTDEIQTNPAETLKGVQWLGGQDNLFTKLWFALPNKKNPYLPY
jgi:hypothetical protein